MEENEATPPAVKRAEQLGIPLDDTARALLARKHLTVPQAARVVGRTRQTISLAAQQRRIRARRKPLSSAYMIRPDALLDWWEHKKPSPGWMQRSAKQDSGQGLDGGDSNEVD